MTIGIAICGDPDRRPLAESLFEIYSSYPFIDKVNLYFRENPAIAFNAAAKEMDVDMFIGIAGDVYVGELELMRFIDHRDYVVCAFSPLTPRRKDIFAYPKLWSERKDWGFISGLFKTPRELLLKHPFVERAKFYEDYFWNQDIQNAGYTITSIQVPCVHIDYHPVFRKRTLIYFMVTFRFSTKPLRGKIKEIAKMLVWEWQEIWAAIRIKPITEEDRWEYEMTYGK